MFFVKRQNSPFIQNRPKIKQRVLHACVGLLGLICLFNVKILLAQVNEEVFDPLKQKSIPNKFQAGTAPFSRDLAQQDLRALSPEEIEQGKAHLRKLEQQEIGATETNRDSQKKPILKTLGKNRKILEFQGPEARAPEDELQADPATHALGTDPEKQALPKNLDKKPESLDSPRSAFEDYLREEEPLKVPEQLEPFGYDLFQSVPERFTPAEDFPVSADYVLGPGDELRITVWGKIDGDFIKTLDRDGKIVLPQLGPLHLAGMSFSEAKTFIHTAFARFYKASEVKINISMGQLRTMLVFVVGKAAHPGSYTLSSFATLINALFISGGPGPIGSMRDIQVKRNGKTVTRFDLYDLILKGDKTGDVRLVSGDVIFIPTIGPRVGISGNIHAPALYEIKKPTYLQDLIEMAGGIRADGDAQRVQLERRLQGRSKIVLDVRLNTLHTQDPVLLKDGDRVQVFAIDDRIKNAVTVKGNVARPGIFEWVEGMRVRDLFHGPEDFLPETFLDYALIERLMPPDDRKTYVSVALKKALFENNAEANIRLQPRDKLVVFQRWDLMEKLQVRISGAVNRPGDYEYRPGMRLSDLFKLAGGLERPAHPDSYLPEGLIIRKMPPDFRGEKIGFDFKKAVLHEIEAENLVLHARDEVYLFDQWALAQEETVHIVGAVSVPGEYAWAKNMRIRDLISLAGGTLYYAFLDTAELTRLTPTPEGPKIERRSVDIQKAISGDPAENIRLQPDDYLSIRAVPEWERYRTVRIEGEVRFPGTYPTRKGERLSSLLERAGGLTENAFPKGAIFTRKSVQVLQQRQLDDAIDRLEQQLLSHSASTIEAALSPEAAQQHKASMGQRDALIAKMRSAKAKGRMSIALGPLDTFKGSASDVVLEEGDVLIVPEQPQQIQVLGAVFNQTAFIFDKDTTVADYLDKAGGLTEDANEDALYILKVDGTAYSERQSEGFWFWKKALKSSVLDPGDTIVVPEQLDKIFWLREVKDMTQILYQMAVTAGVLIVAF